MLKSLDMAKNAGSSSSPKVVTMIPELAFVSLIMLDINSRLPSSDSPL